MGCRGRGCRGIELYGLLLGLRLGLDLGLELLLHALELPVLQAGLLLVPGRLPLPSSICR